MPKLRRRPFYLYVDEFHNFLTLSFADILQNFQKVRPKPGAGPPAPDAARRKLRAPSSATRARSSPSESGIEDAEVLARSFTRLWAADLVNLPNHHIYLKLLIDGAQSEPFQPLHPAASVEANVAQASDH